MMGAEAQRSNGAPTVVWFHAWQRPAEAVATPMVPAPLAECEVADEEIDAAELPVRRQARARAEAERAKAAAALARVAALEAELRAKPSGPS